MSMTLAFSSRSTGKIMKGKKVSSESRKNVKVKKTTETPQDDYWQGEPKEYWDMCAKAVRDYASGKKKPLVPPVGNCG